MVSVSDEDLITKLDSLNQRYRLGLAIKAPSRSLERPDYVDAEEAILWQGINDELDKRQKTEDGRKLILEVLKSYRAWAKKKDDEWTRWVKKPNSDFRLLGIPHSHIIELKRALGVSRNGRLGKRKRTSEELSTAGPLPGQMSRRDVQYPVLPSAQAELTRLSNAQRPQSITGTAPGSTASSKPGSSYGDDFVVHASHQDDRKRRKKASQSTTFGSVVSKTNPPQAYQYSGGLPSKAAPTVQLSHSFASSRNPSFKESFESNVQDDETPATSFESVGPTATDMAPPKFKPAQPIEIPKRTQRQAAQAIVPPPSASQNEYMPTASLEQVLEQVLLTKAPTPARSQRSTSISQASQSTEAYMMQLVEAHEQRKAKAPSTSSSETSGKIATQSTIAASHPDASGKTMIGTQQSSIDSIVSNSQSNGHQPQRAPSNATSVFSSYNSSAISHSAGMSSSSLPTNDYRVAKPTRLERKLFLKAKSPFRKAAYAPNDVRTDKAQIKVGFREVYEMNRFGLLNRYKAIKLAPLMSELLNVSQSSFHTQLLGTTERPCSAFERSQAPAWDAATSDSTTTILSGKLTLKPSTKKKQNGTRMSCLETKFELCPLKIEQSHRLARKFGADRLFYLEMSRIDEFKDALDQEFLQWLNETEHHLLGRSWKCVYLRPVKDSKTDHPFQAVLFAERGYDITTNLADKAGIEKVAPGSGHVVALEQLFDWLLNLEFNSHQAALKLFSRFSLGLTRTTASIVFKHDQIARCEDAWSCCPGPRSLTTNSHTNSHRASRHKHDGKVMNDGCGRISYAAAVRIWRELGLGDTPIAFQARIGGAKGVWFVDQSGEKYNNHAEWIEITDAQHKWDAWTGREDGEDFHRTFEICLYSHPLSCSELSYTLLPILTYGGVPRDTFENLLENEMSLAENKLDDVMKQGGIALSYWASTEFPVAAERASSGTIQRVGGFPDSTGERVLELARTGHRPLNDRILADACVDALERIFRRREEKPAVELPCSTNVLMIADPLGVLEEGEVYLSFSKLMLSKMTGELITAPRDQDVLVTRQPAYLPWDIQKVRAVNKLELGCYRDVIIFSTKGKIPLADKLSGGDYDGDKAWVCWDLSVVDRFENSDFQSAPGPEKYGIKMDKEKAHEVMRRGVSALWQKGVAFNMQTSLLGQCSNYYVGFVYDQASLGHEISRELGGLLGHLVDTAKNGYVFSKQHWDDYRASRGLPKWVPNPAWKEAGAQKHHANLDHVCDHLRFVTFATRRNATLAKYKIRRDKIGEYDGSLAQVYHAETLWAKQQGLRGELKRIEKHLKPEFQALVKAYAREFARSKDVIPWVQESKAMSKDDKSKKRATSHQKMDELRHRFLSLEPPDDSTHPLADRWRAEAQAIAGAKDQWHTNKPEMMAGFGGWTLFKASLLVYTLQRSYKFQYQIACPELGQIKAFTTTHPEDVLVSRRDILASYKVDTSFAKRQAGRLPVQQTDDEDGDGDGVLDRTSFEGLET